MNKSQTYGSSVIMDKYLLDTEPDYVKFMEERLWDNFKDPILKELKENDSVIVEKVFDMQKDLFETNQLQVRQDILVTKLIHCHDCKNYEEGKNGCYGFCNEWNTSTSSYEWCSRAEQKDKVEE